MIKIVDESILFFSLRILSGSSLHFVGIRVVYVRNTKSQFLSKQGILATQSREWNESRANYLARLHIFVM